MSRTPPLPVHGGGSGSAGFLIDPPPQGLSLPQNGRRKAAEQGAKRNALSGVGPEMLSPGGLLNNIGCQWQVVKFRLTSRAWVIRWSACWVHPGNRMERVIAYVDGFNLYFGLKAAGFRRFYWLNVHLLCQNLLKPAQQLACIRYFTSRIASLPDQVKRQGTYLEALQTVTDCGIFYGHYLLNSRTCRKCGFIDQVPTEKMTDVNIAVEMLTDAFQDRFDTALLISADSDLTAPTAAVRRLFPKKRVIIAFPPKRFSITLRRAAHGFIHIERSHLAASQFPDQVVKPDGFILHRPAEWR